MFQYNATRFHYMLAMMVVLIVVILGFVCDVTFHFLLLNYKIVKLFTTYAIVYYTALVYPT